MEENKNLEPAEVKIRLKQIQSEINGLRNFDFSTMAILEERGREVNELAMKIFDNEDEVKGEMESVIIISKDYRRKQFLLEEDVIQDAIRHLDYGIELFIEKI